MPDTLFELMRKVASKERLIMAEGEVLTEPEAAGDDLYVVVPSFDQEYRFGPCPWQPRIDDSGDVIYPHAGDLCIVAMPPEEEERAWVLLWTPYID